MKKTNAILLALGTLGVGAVTPVAFGQAVTIPVGYATTKAEGTFTFMSANLHNPIDFQGLMTGGPLSANAEGDPFVAGAYNQDENSGITKYYMEIAEGDNEGARIDIATNTTGSVVPVEEGRAEFLGLLANATSVIIRKHLTLTDVFGGDGTAAPPDLQIDAGGDAGTADNILLFQGGSFVRYYYSNFFLSPGWRAADGNTDATDIPLDPGAGLVLVDNNGDGDEVTVVGHVKATNTLIPLDEGFNLIGLPVPVDRSLSQIFGTEEANLQITPAADAGGADNVLAWNGTGFDRYFFSTFFLSPGWQGEDAAVAYNDALFVEVKAGNGAKVLSLDLFDESAP